jgi:hypothetical protein
MPDEEQPPALPESRSDRVIKVAMSLSECEQEELRIALNALRVRRITNRLSDLGSCFVVSLHSGALFGVFMGLLIGSLDGIYAGATFGLLAGLLVFAASTIASTLFCGLTMTVILAIVYKLMYPRTAARLSSGQPATFQHDDLEIPLSLSESYSVCKSTLEATKGTRVEKADENSGDIRAVTQMSWRSPGEAVGVKLESIDANRTRAKIYSKDIYNSWGLGKNRKNVRVLKSAIADAANVHQLLRDHEQRKEP